MLSVDLLVSISVLCWGAWGLFEKKALNHSTPRDVAILLYLLNIVQIPVVVLLLNALQPGWHLTPRTLAWSAGAALCYAVAIVSYLSVLKKIDASFVIGCTACYPIVTIFLAAAFLGEPIIANRLAGTVLVVLGVIAMGKSQMSHGETIDKTSKLFFTLCLLTTTLAYGVRSICAKIALQEATPLEVYLGKAILDCVFILIVAFLFKRQGHRFHLTNGRAVMFCTLSTICLAVGGYTYLAAMDKCSASYVVAITSCYPVIMYLLALIFLGERFSRLRLVGISTLAVGAILLQTTKLL